MVSLRTLGAITTMFLLFSCAHGPCLQKAQNPNAPIDTSEKSSVLPQKIRVFKFDGTKQCGQGSQTPLAEMQKELSNVQVYSSSNKNDGQMRIQMCGAPTGNANIYEINRDDLDKAKKAGFKEWIFD